MLDHKKLTEIAETGNGKLKRITNWLHIYGINVSIKLKLMKSREYEMITKKTENSVLEFFYKLKAQMPHAYVIFNKLTGLCFTSIGWRFAKKNRNKKQINDQTGKHNSYIER